MFGLGAEFSSGADFVFYLRQGKRLIPKIFLDRQAYLPLVDLVQALDLPYSESASAGFFQITAGNEPIRLTRNRNLVMLNDQPVALPSPVVYSAQEWLVHPEFISRVLNRVVSDRLTMDSSGSRFIQGGINFNRLNIFDTVSEQGSRITLQFSAPMDVEIRREPQRLVCTMANVPVEPLKTDLVAKDPIVNSINFEELPESNQVIIQLSANSFTSRVTRLSAQNVYLIELTKPAAARSGESSAQLKGNAGSPPPGKRNSLRIFLDPGHGGKETGVKLGEALFEKDQVLQLAIRLRAVLQARLGAEVLLSRQNDQMLSLVERSELSNRVQAQLFISLHIGNSNQSAESVSRVYVFRSELESGEEVDKPSGLFIPWDRLQLNYLDKSRMLAELLQNEVNQQLNGGGAGVTYRQAPLRLLACLKTPAVLLEIGNARQPQFLQQLSTPGFQESLNLAVLTAIDKFINQKGPQ
jgi:N-acetylmuramoyl-L-alanine amidase